MITRNRRTGAIGALLDEYARAVADLSAVIRSISDTDLQTITDPITKDEDCRSVQTILAHVVHSAFGYATTIYNSFGHSAKRPDKIFRNSTGEYLQDFDAFLRFTETVFENITEGDLEQHDENRKMKTRWGQTYDIEQLTEHAIVHILRHRRQIENIKRTFNWPTDPVR